MEFGILMVGIIVALGSGFAAQYVASARGRTETWYFWLGFFLPIIGIVVAFGTPSVPNGYEPANKESSQPSTPPILPGQATSSRPPASPPVLPNQKPKPTSRPRMIEDRLDELDRLRESGVITDDEYKAKRQDIIDSI